MADILILIRHPKKVGEDDTVYLGPTAMISEEGKQEMELIIPRLMLLNPTVVISSEIPRAVVLGQHIADRLGLSEPLKTGLLNEIDKPRYLIGKKRTGRLYKRVTRALRRAWDSNRLPKHLLRGEKIRFRKQIERDVLSFLRMAEQYKPTRYAPAPEVIVGVSHAQLIAAIGHMIYRNDRTLIGYYKQADRAFKVSTTGITILERVPDRRTHKLGWRIRTWNEEAHMDIGQYEALRSIIKDI